MVADSLAPGFLAIAGLAKSYGALPVVQDLSLAIGKGEFVSILGPSGCGKTTTLRMLAGFIPPNAGSITLDGERIETKASHLRGAAMVFQNYALFPHMTVAENVGFGLRMQKRPKPEIAARVAEALDLVRLPGFEGRYPRELSGGQQQRVALARAIILKPKLLLLDEPLSNLDAKLRKDLRAQFLEIHRLARITTIFVTHDLEEAFSMSDRVAVMSQGRLEQFATPVEIFTRPATAFVAEFVGHSNVIEGEITAATDGTRVLRTGGFGIRVPAGGTGTRGRFAVPGHALRLDPAGTDNSLDGQLAHVAFLGSTIQFAVEAAGIRLTGETGTTREALHWRAGTPVRIGWNSADMIELPI